MRDPRITASIAIDPGWTQAFTAASVAPMHGPVLLINLGTAGTRWQAVGVGPEGSDLAARLPATTFVEVAPAHHFTFLPECKPDAPAILAIEGEEAICDDPPGTGRAAVHRRIVEAVAALLAL